MANNYRLRRQRIRHNWRQEDLANQLGVNVATVQRWERGSQRPTPYYQVKLCDLFDTSAQELGLQDDELPLLSNASSGDPSVSVSLSSAEDPALWMIPYPRNPYFTGREDLLTTLEQRFASFPFVPPLSPGPAPLVQMYAMKGLGGIGKTQIAIEYAYRASQQGRYIHTLWLAAASEETLLNSFAALYDQISTLRLTQETDKRVLAARVKHWLEQCSEPWLLIVDNADEFSFLPAYLPVQGQGRILLTTRASAVGALALSLEVDLLSLEEGVLLLLRRAQRQGQANAFEQEDARTIVSALDRFPLAIDQAGAYLEETRSSLHAYAQLLQDYHYALLARRGKQASGYPDSVATTWALSFEYIERADPAAGVFLQLCSVVAPDHFPEEVLTAGMAVWPEALRAVVTDPLRFNQMLETVLSFSLITRMGEERLLSMHRLVQMVQRERMTPEELHQWAERLVRAIHTVFPHDPENEITTWPQCQRYLEQAYACDRLIQEFHLYFPEAAELLERLGSYLCERALYSLAEPLLRRSLMIWEHHLEGEQPPMTRSLHHLATLYWKQGKYAQAELLYQRVLRIYEQHLEPDHFDVAEARNNLALIFFDQGKYVQAEELYQQSIEYWRQDGGIDHLGASAPLHNLAILYWKQGKYAQAEPLYQRALSIREQWLGPDHLQVAWPLHNLAILYSKQGKYAQAEPLFRRALRIYEQHLGDEHPSVAVTLHGLASLYANLRKDAQAEVLYQRALRIYEQRFGLEHPTIASFLVSFAALLSDQGKETQAEQLCHRALRIYENQLGSKHSSMAFPLHQLALVAAKRRKDEEAERLDRQALGLWEEHLGSDHPNLAYALHGLALLSARQGLEQQADGLFQRALSLREQHLDPAHLETANLLLDYARYRHKQGRMSEAISLYQRALAIREQHWGRDHPLLTEIHIRLQEAQQALGVLEN